MPWNDDIKTDSPTDLEFVSEGANRFRELKRALIERLSTAYKAFPGEHPDREGEAKLFPIVSVQVGKHAERPSAPDREGMGWFSTDTRHLYIADRDFQWRRVTTPFDLADPDDPNLTVLLPRFRAVKTEQSQEISSANTPTSVEFHGGDIVYQRDGQWYDANQSLTDFVVPESGPYALTAEVSLNHASGDTDFRYVTNAAIRVNGTDIAAGSAENVQFGLVAVVTMSTQVELSEGDVIDLRVWNANFDGGDDRGSWISTVNNPARLSVSRLGPRVDLEFPDEYEEPSEYEYPEPPEYPE